MVYADGRVITGFSHPVAAFYKNPGGPGSYTDGFRLARGVSVDINVNTADDNIFYANNAAAESEQGIFTDGIMTLGLDGLHPEVQRKVLGLDAPRSVEVSGKTIQLSGTGTGAKPPALGVGFVIEFKSGGQSIYVPYYMTKAKFRQGGFRATTRQGTIDWQSAECTVDLYRDDTDNHYWQETGQDCTTESEAIEILEALLAVSAEAANGG